MNIVLNTKYIFLFCFLSAIAILPQTKTEDRFEKTLELLANQNKELDSLNLILTEKVNLINTEKSRKNPNSEKVTELLSNTSKLTNSIEKLELEISSTNKELESVKKILFNYYTSQIDSLKALDPESNTDEIIVLTEKKLSVSNKIDLLSFDPSKVLNIKPTKNVTKQKVYNEFLISAKNEVDSKISEIKKLKEEVNNILALNSAKEEFLEEISFNNRIVGTKKIDNQTSTESSDYYSNPDVTNARNSVKEYSASFNGILNQLSLNNISSTQMNTSRKLNSDYYTSTNLKDFLKLMNKVEKELSDYKLVINNKIKNN